MLIEELKGLELSKIKQQYLHWLQMQELAQSTITVSKNDAFYILKHKPDYEFWRLVDNKNKSFEVEAKKILSEILTRSSREASASNINYYMAHLRRFRRYLNSDFTVTSSKPPSQGGGMGTNKKKGTVTSIPYPCSKEVDKYLKEWDETDKYRLQEQTLDKLFNEFAPYNTDIRDILIKVATLNDFYSTNIFSIEPVAIHILKLNLDERLNRGDTTLIGDLKAVEIGGKIKNLYSFATKYCSHHKPLDFPIYDSYVRDVLIHFRNVECFSSFSKDDLKKYGKFKEVLRSFQRHFKLEKYSLKELDKYLWLMGKEYFPKKYKRKKEESI